MNAVADDDPELYDGPEPIDFSAIRAAQRAEMGRSAISPSPAVAPAMPPAPAAAPPNVAEIQKTAALMRLALMVISARLLGLLGVLGAIPLFIFAVYDAQPWRIAAAAAYAMTVFWPAVFLYLRKG